MKQRISYQSWTQQPDSRKSVPRAGKRVRDSLVRIVKSHKIITKLIDIIYTQRTWCTRVSALSLLLPSLWAHMHLAWLIQGVMFPWCVPYCVILDIYLSSSSSAVFPEHWVERFEGRDLIESSDSLPLPLPPLFLHNFWLLISGTSAIRCQRNSAW